MKNIYRMVLLFSFSMFGLTGCPSDIENLLDYECLSHGENCSTSYIQNNYGVSSLPCCTSGDVCQQQFSSSTQVTCN